MNESRVLGLAPGLQFQAVLLIAIAAFCRVTQGKQPGPVEPWFPSLQDRAVYSALPGLLGGLMEPASVP